MSEESDALLHIADDHPCCKPTLLWAHNRLLKLERDNAALKQRIIHDNKAYGCEIREPSRTIWDHAQKLQMENNALRVALEDIMTEADEQVIWRMARAALEKSQKP